MNQQTSDRPILAGALIAALVLVTGCVGGVPAAQVTNAPQANGAADYIVGPGDSLQVFVWGHDDLTTEVVVRPDGEISTPLVEDMVAAGKTPTNLARDIEEVLLEYVRSPTVTVMVSNFVGEYESQIRVVGQAMQPTSLPYRNGMTLLDVMIAVGGLSEFAAGNKAQVVRRIDGEEKVIRVRIDDLLNEGRMDQNVRMLPGDVLIIPESFF
ncbi:MAG: XrtA/PEP-CTERM system exopolysaccharide export protein [Pseudomonadota bacterium]